MTKSSFFDNINPKNVKPFLKIIIQAYTFKFFLLCTSVYLGIKGIINEYVKASELPYYRSIKHDGVVYQTNSAISAAPWSIKGFYGMLSDILPLFGYRKRYYMIITNIFGTIGCLVVFFLPLDVAHQYPFLPALAIFCINGQTASHDLLCEGKYVEFMRRRPETSSHILTYIWLLQVSAGFLPASTVGPISDYSDPRYLFLIMTPVSAQPLIFIFAGCMVEDKVSKEENNSIDWVKIKREFGAFAESIIILIFTIGTVTAGLLGNSTLHFTYGIISSVIICASCYIFLPKMIAHANLYIFIVEVSYINIAGAVEYFYTADEECLPGGPHFSYLYFRTYSSFAGIFASMFGLYLYQIWLRNLKYRPIFWLTTILRIIGSCFDIIIVRRWNKMIGISDHAMYLLGSTIIYQTTFMLNTMPINILISRLCPRSIEATIYALLAGFAWYGLNLAKYIGAFLIEQLNIVTIPTKEQNCDFTNMWLLILISHCLMPLLNIPLSFIFLPDAHVHDNILNETDVSIGYSEIIKKRKSPLKSNI